MIVIVLGKRECIGDKESRRGSDVAYSFGQTWRFFSWRAQRSRRGAFLGGGTLRGAGVLFWTVLVTKSVLRGYVACSEGLTWRAFFRGAFFWARGGLSRRSFGLCRRQRAFFWVRWHFFELRWRFFGRWRAMLVACSEGRRI